MKQLIAFFSHCGENYDVGLVKIGNTAKFALAIQEATNADIFEIKPLKPYPQSYMECVEIAKKEYTEVARPPLAKNLENANEYDTIYLGFPNWWGDLPMCVYTFLESIDLRDKTIIPFCTHEGSGFGNIVSFIRDFAEPKNAVVKKGLAIKGSVAQKKERKVKKLVAKWLQDLSKQ